MSLECLESNHFVKKLQEMVEISNMVENIAKHGKLQHNWFKTEHVEDMSTDKDEKQST